MDDNRGYTEARAVLIKYFNKFENWYIFTEKIKLKF